MASARSERLASMWAAANLERTKQANEQLLNEARDRNQSVLEQYSRSGLDALGAGYDQAKSDLDNAAGAARDALRTGYDTASRQIGDGFDKGLDALQRGIDRLDPYAKAGADALKTYRGSLGLGGAGERDAAEKAFQASPGYQYRVDQATDAAARKAASLGIAGSGNTLDAVTRIGEQLADQDYSAWQNRLSGLSKQGQDAAQSQAGLDSQIAGLQTQKGKSLASESSSYGSRLADLERGIGQDRSGLDAALGQGRMSALTKLGGNISDLNWQTTKALVDSNNLTTSSENTFAYNAAKASDAARSQNDAMSLKIAGMGIKALGALGGML